RGFLLRPGGQAQADRERREHPTWKADGACGEGRPLRGLHRDHLPLPGALRDQGVLQEGPQEEAAMKSIRVLAILTVFAAACGTSGTVEDKPTPPPKERPKPAAKTKKAGGVDPDYVYSPVGKRDPFRPYLDRSRSTGEVDPSCGP